MASPRYGFGAHDRNWLASSHFGQRLQALFEFRRLHIVGEPAEGEIAPACIERIFSRMTQAAQLGHVRVADVCALQRVRQLVHIELRIVARSGNLAHVYQPLDAVVLE